MEPPRVAFFLDTTSATPVLHRSRLGLALSFSLALTLEGLATQPNVESARDGFLVLLAIWTVPRRVRR